MVQCTDWGIEKFQKTTPNCVGIDSGVDKKAGPIAAMNRQERAQRGEEVLTSFINSYGNNHGQHT